MVMNPEQHSYNSIIDYNLEPEIYSFRVLDLFNEQLLHKGIYVVAFSYPVVPKGLARIRTQMSAAHTLEQIDKAVAAFIKVGTSLGVIGKAEAGV